MHDCKFKGPESCANRPANGLAAVSHCLVCWLAKDRERAAHAIRVQEARAKAFSEQSAARLERLRVECCGMGHGRGKRQG